MTYSFYIERDGDDDVVVATHGPIYASFTITDDGMRVRYSNIKTETEAFATLAIKAAQWKRRNWR